MNRTRSQIVLENISGTQMYANLAIAETRPVRQEQPPQVVDDDDHAPTILGFLLMCMVEQMKKVMMGLILICIWYYLSLPSAMMEYATYAVGPEFPPFPSFPTAEEMQHMRMRAEKINFPLNHPLEYPLEIDSLSLVHVEPENKFQVALYESKSNEKDDHRIFVNKCSDKKNDCTRLFQRSISIWPIVQWINPNSQYTGRNTKVFPLEESSKKSIQELHRMWELEDSNFWDLWSHAKILVTNALSLYANIMFIVFILRLVPILIPMISRSPYWLLRAPYWLYQDPHWPLRELIERLPDRDRPFE